MLGVPEFDIITWRNSKPHLFGDIGNFARSHLVEEMPKGNRRGLAQDCSYPTLVFFSTSQRRQWLRWNTCTFINSFVDGFCFYSNLTSQQVMKLHKRDRSHSKVVFGHDSSTNRFPSLYPAIFLFLFFNLFFGFGFYCLSFRSEFISMLKYNIYKTVLIFIPSFCCTFTYSPIKLEANI